DPLRMRNSLFTISTSRYDFGVKWVVLKLHRGRKPHTGGVWGKGRNESIAACIIARRAVIALHKRHQGRRFPDTPQSGTRSGIVERGWRSRHQRTTAKRATGPGNRV